MAAIKPKFKLKFDKYRLWVIFAWLVFLFVLVAEAYSLFGVQSKIAAQTPTTIPIPVPKIDQNALNAAANRYNLGKNFIYQPVQIPDPFSVPVTVTGP